MNNQNTTDRYSFDDIKRGLKVMFEHTAGFRWPLFWVFILVIISGALQAAQPLVFGKIVDAINSSATSPHLTLTIIGLLAILLISNSFLSNLQGRLSTLTDEKMRLTLLHRLYSWMLKLPIAFHKTHRSGELNEKINRGVQAIPSFWSNYVFNVIPQIAYLVFSLCIIFISSPLIGWILLPTAFIYSALSVAYVRPFARLQRSIQDSYNKARGTAGDALFNVRMVKEAVMEEKESEKMYHAWFDRSMGLWKKLMQQTRNLALAQNTISISARIAALWIAYQAFLGGHITIGLFTAIITYTAGFFSPLQQLFRQWRDIQNALISIEDANNLLLEKSEQYAGAPIENVAGRILFDNVSFAYGESMPILQNVSFVVDPGKVIAFVGESGVGKSSIIDLISSYYVPEKGDIIIDGVNTKEIDLVALRKEIAVVSQEITLFNATVMENIRYGVPNATDEQVRRAAEKAKCDFIERLPKKWEQLVGERGMKLSVGQKQRIAIARAFLRDPKILILDEPTSALDAASERHIVQSLDEIMKGRTTLIIAHRLSTIRKADQILVFKEGNVVESGTYAELVSKDGEFKRLRDLQALAE